MADSLDIPKTYLEQLPETLRAQLGRGAADKRSNVLSPELQEVVAREALSCGLRQKGPAFTYLVMRLRHGLGVGSLPSPPSLPPGELAYVDGRIAAILDRLGAEKRAA